VKAHDTLVVPEEDTRALVVLLVDTSYSMKKIHEEAQDGIRDFIKKQASIKGVKVKVALYRFASDYSLVWGPLKAKDALPCIIEPNGNTALYDAVARCIKDTKAVIEGLKKKPSKVVLALMTDGEENDSKEYKFEDVAGLIDQQKESGWEIIFLAGSLKAVGFGVASGLNTTGYDPSRAGQTYAIYDTASNATASYLAGATRSVEMPTQVPDKADANG
jgi:uncharacterized protein YegL